MVPASSNLLVLKGADDSSAGAGPLPGDPNKCAETMTAGFQFRGAVEVSGVVAGPTEALCRNEARRSRPIRTASLSNNSPSTKHTSACEPRCDETDRSCSESRR